jgi:hypothetical protein
LQVKPHVLVVQVAVAFAGAVHPCPHAEQLPGSLVSSTHRPLQREYPVWHEKEQALLMHSGVAWVTAVEHVAHVVPLPHAVAEVPGWQAPPVQQPPEHWYVEPHPPQLLKSVCVSTHAPLHMV